jgi:hypothetical protein
MLSPTNQINTANDPGQPSLPFTIPSSVRRPDTAHPINCCDTSVNYQHTSVINACFPRAPIVVSPTAWLLVSACLSTNTDATPRQVTGLSTRPVCTFHARCCRIAGKNRSSILSTHFPEVSRKNGHLSRAPLSSPASASVRSMASLRNSIHPRQLAQSTEST